MAQRQFGAGVDDVAVRARADGEDRARPVAGADEHVLGPVRAMDEVPLAQRSLLALDQQQALTRQDEEVLLLVLAVVLAGRLAGGEHADVEPEPGELAASPSNRV